MTDEILWNYALWSTMFCNDCVSKLLNKPPYGRQNQTNRHYMFREINSTKSYMSKYNVWLTFAMLHRIEIAFIPFKLLRLECEQIILESDLPQIDLFHEFHSSKAVLKVSAMSFPGHEVAEPATKLRTTNLHWQCSPEGNLVASIWQFYCLFEKKQMMLVRVHNWKTAPLSTQN